MKKSLFINNLQRFRMVTFDITDTLIRFSRPPALQYLKTANELGVTNLDQEAVINCFKKEFKAQSALHPNWGYKTPNYTWHHWWKDLVYNIFRCLKPDISEAKLEELANTLIHIYRTDECYNHIDGGIEMLDKIRTTRKYMGVISNSDPSLREVLKSMKLIDKFDFVVTSHDVGFQKPSKEIFNACLKKYNIKPSEALHIGNMYELDYMGACNAGWSSLLITTNASDLEKCQPTQGYKNIKDLLNALENKEIKW